MKATASAMPGRDQPVAAFFIAALGNENVKSGKASFAMCLKDSGLISGGRLDHQMADTSKFTGTLGSNETPAKNTTEGSSAGMSKDAATAGPTKSECDLDGGAPTAEERNERSRSAITLAEAPTCKNTMQRTACELNTEPRADGKEKAASSSKKQDKTEAKEGLPTGAMTAAATDVCGAASNDQAPLPLLDVNSNDAPLATLSPSLLTTQYDANIEVQAPNEGKGKKAASALHGLAGAKSTGAPASADTKAVTSQTDKVVDSKHGTDRVSATKDLSDKLTALKVEKTDANIRNSSASMLSQVPSNPVIANVAGSFGLASAGTAVRPPSNRTMELHTNVQAGLHEAGYRQGEITAFPESTAALLSATPKTLEVGMVSATHGWLKIRAELDQGIVTASVTTRSTAIQDMLHHELPSLNAFLQEEMVSSTVAVLKEASFAGTSQNGELSRQQQSGYQQASRGDDTSSSAENAVWESSGQSAPWWTHNGDMTLLPAMAGGSGGWLNIRV